MKSALRLLLLLFSLALVPPVFSQVPSTLNYQGRMAVGGVNFTGTGLFKFALVNSDGTQTVWSNDGTSTAGGQPAAAVSVPVASGLYSVQLGDTSLANMTAVPAAAFSSPGVSLRIWFSDGAHGFEPMTPDQKLASVGYAMVAATVPDGSITAAKLAPGVGGGGGGGGTVADGSITGTKLAPGAAAANLAAGGLGTVPFGGLIASTEAQSDELLAQGYMRDSGTLAVDAAWLPMPSGDTVAGHTAVWTGTELLIWGGVEPVAGGQGMSSSYSAINRGVRHNPATGAWAPISTTGAPQGRFGHSAVWTGTEMIIWGGQSTQGAMGSPPPGVLATGGRYNPATNTWSSMAPNAAAGSPPGMVDARRGHLAFCTPTEMLIWGGVSNSQEFGSTSQGGSSLRGRRYHLASNTWSDMAVTNMELMGAMSHKGVWTGTEMIIWGGGTTMPGMPPRAGRYNPATDTWSPLPAPAGNPTMADAGFSVMWTGAEMIVWGGTAMGNSFLNTGYRFNPAGNEGVGSWSAVNAATAPPGRGRHHAVWSGTEMIVWGGYSVTTPPTATLLNTGGRYDPATDTWQALGTTEAPPGRAEATVTMAGDKLVVWAGLQSDPSSSTLNHSFIKYLKHGGIYQPATDTWTPLSNGSPAPRFGHTAVWTGSELIVWGGTTSVMSMNGLDLAFGDGARFNPQTGKWTPLPGLNAPAARHGHTAVWTGTEMIIWGGQSFPPPGTPTPTVVHNTGARYNPATNAWTPMSTTGAPAARSSHVAVHAADPVNPRMIVWGGSNDGSTVPSMVNGGIYNLSTDTWSTMSDAPAMPNRYQGLWTDTTMTIFGGSPAKGYRYSPGADWWFPTADPPAELSQFAMGAPALVWTGPGPGGQMLVFAPGTAPAFAALTQFDTWENLSTNGIPAHSTGNSSTYATAVWTGSEMIVWGLADSSNPAATTMGGARYSPAAGTWTPLPTRDAPTKAHGTHVWAGNEMLLWGGYHSNGVGNVSDKGHRYCLPKTYYFYRKL